MSKTEVHEEISGFFLHFTDEERELLREGLSECELELTVDGLKEYLLSSMQEELEDEDDSIKSVDDIRDRAGERIAALAITYAKEHPEMVAQAKSLGTNIWTAINNKLTKKKGQPV